METSKIIKNVNELTVSTWFKTLRKEQKLTMQNLSDMSGLSLMTISRIERGKNFPSQSTINSLLRLMYSDDDKRFEKELATYNTLRNRHLGGLR